MPRRAPALTEKKVRSSKPRSSKYDIRDGSVTGLMLRILPSGSKRYYIRPSRNATHILIGDARVLTLTQARGKAVEVLSAHSTGELPALLNKNVTLSTYLDETYGPVVKLKNKTANKDIRRIQDKFPSLLSKPLNEITHAKLEKYRLDRLKAGIAKSTINRDISPLKRALNFAVERGILAENSLAKLGTFTAKELDNEIVRYLSPAEKERLSAALDRADGHIVPIVKLALNTGMRRGEIFSLEWGDVDFYTKTLTIRAAASKGGKRRVIPLNPEIVKVLKGWRKQAGDSSYVFAGKDGGRLVDIKKAFTSLMREANIKEFTFHMMRHVFASELVMNGTDLNTVREILGHTDLRMTLRYAHINDRIKEDAVKLVAF